MIKQYFTQAWAQLRQQPMISAVSIAGTALAIFLIMLVVMMQQVKVAPFAPESNRDRFLHVHYMSITNKSWGEGNSSNGPMGIKTALECFKSLKTPEAVTIYTCMVISTPVNLPGQPATGIDLLQTDDTFWRVFDFSFVAGKPYDQATFDAGLPVAVITESVARRLFQTTEAVGREFLLNHAPYTVSGVVKDVSTLANTAYAQVWVPYTSTEITKSTWSDEHMGMMSVTILAKSRDDFPAIREETERRRQEYDTVIGENGYSLIYRNRPYDQEKCRRNGCQHRTGRGPGTQAASHYLHHSTDCSCHQPQLDDAEPSAPACGRDWCAPGIRFNETGTDGANHCRKSGGDIAGRGDGIVAECSIRLFGKYTAVCAGIQPDAESSGSGCKHIAAWLHLWLGVVVLLCAELTKFRYSRMACIKNRDCKCIGRTFA